MNKAKRVIQRPYGRRKNGGWVIRQESLIKALKDGDAAELGKFQVGARQLRQLVSLMAFPDEEVLVTFNGKLEVRNICKLYAQSRDGLRRAEFRVPHFEHSFRLINKAWLPDKPKVVLVIKPKKYG